VTNVTKVISIPGDFMQQLCVNMATHSTGSSHNGSQNNSYSGNWLQKQSVASQDILWKGKAEKIHELKEGVEGHFIQALMGHCVHTDFFHAYLVKGETVLRSHIITFK
jgi:hypothetical protein